MGVRGGKVPHKMRAALDRFQEAHFHIHGMERFYHNAEPFRWTLNCFLRALKEVPQILQMELQKEQGFAEWLRAERKELKTDALISFLAKRRDFVVHQGMLVPGSQASIGITEGRGMKLGLRFPFDPFLDSDDAMDSYLARGKDVLGILSSDDESAPCVFREWRLAPLAEEISSVAARAWLRVGQVIVTAMGRLGEDAPGLALDCLHSSQQRQFRVYKRKALKERRARLLAAAKLQRKATRQKGRTQARDESEREEREDS